MIIGKKIYRAHTIDDSMAWARAHFDTAPDGAVFLADVLTQAKGRQNRVWKLYPEQLIITFLLKPPLLKILAPEDLHIRLNQLSMALGLGFQEPLEQFNVNLKWPNDFVVQNKKVGGMLINLVWSGSEPLGIIVGFALNVNHHISPDDSLFGTATSLSMITGTKIERRKLYKEIIESLNRWYAAWTNQYFMEIYKQWKNKQAYLGKNILIHQKDGALIEGLAQQVLPNGDLIIVGKDNKQKTISFFQVEEFNAKL